MNRRDFIKGLLALPLATLVSKDEGISNLKPDVTTSGYAHVNGGETQPEGMTVTYSTDCGWVSIEWEPSLEARISGMITDKVKQLLR